MFEDNWKKELEEQERINGIMVKSDNLIKSLDVAVEFEKRIQGKQAQEAGTKFLPDVAELKEFIDDFKLFRAYSVKLNPNTGELVFDSRGIRMKLRIEGILELLSEKLSVPLLESEEIKSKPPFIEDMDRIINHKMEWIKAEFNRIIAVDDPRIQKICRDYFAVQSYPLNVKLKYMEWKEKVVGWNIQKIKAELEDELSLKSRNIQREYNNRLANEKKGLLLKIERLEKESLKMTTTSEQLSSMYQSAKMDIDAKTEEIGILVIKNKEADESLMRSQAENTELRADRELLTRKINKYEALGWVSDFATSKEHPIFCNPKENLVIRFPCSMSDFKKLYTMKSTDGNARVYTDKDGSEFKIPESLALKIPDLITPKPREIEEEKKKTKTEEEAERENDLKEKTIDILAEAESTEHISGAELARRVGAKDESNYRKRSLNPLVESGKILKDADKKYYINPEYRDMGAEED